MDRLLKSNTARKRVQSLFRQGCMLYELMPGMSEQRLAPLVERFVELIHPQCMVQNASSRLSFEGIAEDRDIFRTTNNENQEPIPARKCGRPLRLIVVYDS
jgi:hypothetical protein